MINNYDHIFLFNQRKNKASKNLHFIVNYLENEQVLAKNEINKDINSFIKNLLKKNFIFNKNDKIILSSLFFEKNIFINDFYFKFYQIKVFDVLFKKFKNNKNTVYDFNDIFYEKYFKKKINTNYFKFLINILISFIKASRYHLTHNLNFKSEPSKKSSSMLLFVDDGANLDAKTGSSKIWSILIKKLKINFYNELFINSFHQKSASLKKNYFLNNYNNLSSFIKSFIQYILLSLKISFFFKNFKTKNKIDNVLFEYFKLNFVSSNLIKAINDCNIFSNFFSKNKFDLIFHNFENQSWEKIMIYQAKKYNNKCKIFSYIYTPIRYWDIRYDPTNFKYLNKLLSPNLICVSTSQCLKSMRPVRSLIQVKKVEALRYLNLQKYKKINHHHNILNKFNVFGDILPNSTINLFKLLNLYSKKNNRLRVYFKPHPLNIINIEKYDHLTIKRYKKHKDNNYFIFPNYTTASFDFYYQNKICLTFLDSNNFNLSPLFKIRDYKYYFYDLESFIKIINVIILNKDFKSYNIYNCDHLIFWKKLLNENNYQNL